MPPTRSGRDQKRSDQGKHGHGPRAARPAGISLLRWVTGVAKTITICIRLVSIRIGCTVVDSIDHAVAVSIQRDLKGVVAIETRDVDTSRSVQGEAKRFIRD